jgi:hypothetical protein
MVLNDSENLADVDFLMATKVYFVSSGTTMICLHTMYDAKSQGVAQLVDETTHENAYIFSCLLDAMLGSQSKSVTLLSSSPMTYTLG